MPVQNMAAHRVPVLGQVHAQHTSQFLPSLRVLSGQHRVSHMAAGSGGTAAIFALGMCRDCFRDYLDNSGGTHGSGADPPSFGPAKKKPRLALKEVCSTLQCTARELEVPDSAGPALQPCLYAALAQFLP